jgi:hypothetical protein
MARQYKSTDIDDAPELLRLIDEVRSEDEPRVLKRAGEDVAILMPVQPRRRHTRTWQMTPEKLAAIQESAGTWADVDIDRFLQDIYADRAMADRPRVDL